MKKNILLLTIVCLSLLSCNHKRSSFDEVEYFPYQQNEGGKWGLISTDGKVLFSEMFDNEPTMAINGRFMVKNMDGLWEIYSAEAEPQKIGGEYLQAGMFYEDVAPVVEKGKPIQFINRDGKVKVTLEDIGDAPVTECKQFSGGLAPIKVGGLWGAVDTKGNVVVEPLYTWLDIDETGKIVGLEEKYEKSGWDEKRFSILNIDGKNIGYINAKSIDELRYVQYGYRSLIHCIGDGVIVSVQTNGKNVDGLLGINGEWLIKPSEKILKFHEYRDGYFTYSNENGYGVAELDGDIVLQAEFKELYLSDGGLLLGKKTESEGYALYNIEGEKLGKNVYQQVFSFHKNKEYTIAHTKEGGYLLIGRGGKEKELENSVFHISGIGTIPTYKFDRDCIDMSDIVKGLNITKNGFLGMTTELSVPKAIDTFNNNNHTKERINGNPYNYSYGYGVNAIGSILFGVASAYVYVNIFNHVVRGPIERNGFILNGFKWDDKPVTLYNIEFCSDTSKRLEGRMKELFDVLVNVTKSTGKVIKKSINANVVDTGNGNYYHVYCAGDKVGLYYGKFNPDNVMITHYDKASEKNPVRVVVP